MPRLAKIWIAYDRTVNLGDYNSAKVQFGASVEIEPGDDPESIMKGVWDMAKNNVKAQIVPLIKKDAKIAADMEELFLGLKIVQQGQDPEAALVDRFTNKDTPITWVNGKPPEFGGEDPSQGQGDGITMGFEPEGS